ncbi:hypothetical protein Y032_0031g2279 [Ancylostoma ceylanicum]|nr:hypothetical protein Y032_0031g2279 [Ancylostoma ceylanicum]
MDDDVKRLEAEAVTLRRVAFVGVAISTVATLVCVISVPLLYNYLQHMQSVMQSEVDFCKSRSGNIWREITRTQPVVEPPVFCQKHSRPVVSAHVSQPRKPRLEGVFRTSSWIPDDFNWSQTACVAGQLVQR